MPKKAKQQSFWSDPGKSHGGDYRIGQRKIARPIATKRPMHLTLKSSRARGQWNFLKQERAIQNELNRVAKRFEIRIYRLQNVGNHLHLLVQARRRRDFQNFLRVLPQAIAFLVAKARKGNPIGRFWDQLACTRVIEWGKDWRGTNNYLEKNKFEAFGMPRDVVDTWFEMAGG